MAFVVDDGTGNPTAYVLTQFTPAIEWKPLVNVVGGGSLGYGAGSGGTVTQATSKATTVTLNKPTGDITMNNAALAAGASVIFTLNNSLINFYDTCITNPRATNNYDVRCINCSSGAATIRVTNITGGTLSESFGINFTLIKGSPI